MRSQSVISFLALAGLLAPLSAHSAPKVTTAGDGSAASRVVRFGDLNLDSDAGVRVLYSRIRSAAQEVCEPAIFNTSNTDLRQRRCAQHAIRQAVLDVGSPQLTSFHVSKTSPVATAQLR
jgi:UrcA family protein